MSKKNMRKTRADLSDELMLDKDLAQEDYEELQMHCMLEAELSDSEVLLDGIMTDLKSSEKPKKIKARPPHRLKKVKKKPNLRIIPSQIFAEMRLPVGVEWYNVLIIVFAAVGVLINIFSLVVLVRKRKHTMFYKLLKVLDD